MSESRNGGGWAMGSPMGRQVARTGDRPRFDVARRPGFRQVADEAGSRRLPYLDDGMLEIDVPERPVRSAPPHRARSIEVPEQVLRIVVGDLAPQVQSILAFVQTNEMAGAAASVGSVALGALIIPALFR